MHFRPGRPVKATGFSREQLVEIPTRIHKMGGRDVPFYSMPDVSYPH
jgi:hypothetical protein